MRCYFFHLDVPAHEREVWVMARNRRAAYFQLEEVLRIMEYYSL